MQQTKELGTLPIGKLIARFSIPAVIAMLVNAIYNVVDRIFIGKVVGEAALAGLTIVFPIMMIIFAFAGLIGIGGSALLSIKLGEKDYKGASHVFGNTVVYGLAFTGVILFTFFVNLDGMLALFGGEGEVLYHAKAYMNIILMGFIFQMLSFILSNFVRTEGKPMLSMTAMIVSAVTNIILDYVLIVLLGMGVEGAAIGTIAGQFIGLIMYLHYYLTGKSNIHLHRDDFIPDFRLLLRIMSIGFATFISNIGTSVAMTFINRYLAIYGGTNAVTSMGAINSLFTFFIMPIMGITQGMQPIIGYNYGAKAMGRVYETLKIGLLIGTIFSTFVFIVMEIWAPTFVLLFLSTGSDTVLVAAKGLRIFIAMLPILSISFMGTAFFQSIAMGRVSMILGMLRQFIFLLPALFILARVFGLDGVWWATPVADLLSVIVTLAFLLKKIKDDRIGFTEVSRTKLAMEEG